MIERVLNREPIYVLYPEDFLEGMSNGFTVYKGIVVVWDEDQDTRILTFIDDLTFSLEYLFGVQESEGGLSLIWNGQPLPGYEEGKMVEVENDSWFIASSIALTRHFEDRPTR